MIFLVELKSGKKTTKIEMERQIQPGDFVICGSNMLGSIYKIESYTPEKIIIYPLEASTKRASVLRVGGVWKFEGCGDKMSFHSPESFIDWLNRNKFTLDQNGANRASSLDRVDILTWMEERGTYPDQTGVDKAAYFGRLKSLEWLEKRGKLPTVQGANIAARYGHNETLEWLRKRGIFPNQEGANRAAMFGHLDTLRWMEARGLPIPDRSGANSAEQNKYNDVVDWLASQGIHP